MDKERFFDLFSHTQVYDLEQPLSSEAPLLPLLVPGFTYTLHRRHEEGTGDPRTAASGFIATTDHAGTHIDALCHVAEDLCLHGGEKVTFRVQTPTGFTRLGAETIAPLLSRGVLLDVAGYRGVDWIKADQPVSRQDLEAVCLHQHVTLHEGDVALVRTGNGARWHDPSGYLSSGGVRADASQWLAEQHVRAVGADHMSWDTDGRVDPDLGASFRLDVVVNNAGVTYSGPLEAFTLEQVRQQFETNVFSVLRVNRAVLPHMREQGGGLLLQIGSIAGLLALPFFGLYVATKFALEGLTESYRYELAPFGIDAAIIVPGLYPTPIAAKHQSAADTERTALYQAAIDKFMTPLYAGNRSATPPDPQEVADAVAHVIAQPAGERPLHTVVATVALRQAPQAINDAVTQATRSFFETLDLPLATLAPKGEKERKRR